MCVLFYFLGCYRHSTNKNGQQTDLGGYQCRLQLFIYVHGVPGDENMGGNIPTYFLVYSKGIISRQISSREECASNWLKKPLHLVTILLATGSSELFNKIDTTVYIQILQVHLQFIFPQSHPHYLPSAHQFHIDTNQIQYSFNYLYIP